QRGRAGGGTHLAPGPEAAVILVTQPEHEVGEGEVGNDLPVGHESQEPVDVVGVEFGVGTHQFSQRGHSDSLGPAPESQDDRLRTEPVHAPAPMASRTGRMTAMGAGYWRGVVRDGVQVPPDRSLGDLTAELTSMLGSPDPELRDGLAMQVLTVWIGRGVYDELLVGLGDGMVAGLRVGIG